MASTDQSSRNKYERGASVTLCLISFLIFINFLGILQNHYNLVSDLIPDSAVIEIDKPLLNQAVFLSFFLFLSVLLRAFKKMKAAFFLDIISLTGTIIVAKLSFMA